LITRLQALDEEVTLKLRIAEKPGLLRTIAGILAHSGDSWLWIVGLGILYFFSTDTWKRVVLEDLISILVLAVIVMIIKFTVRRKRPEGQWGQIYRRTDPHSFPSGHAARASLIAVLAVGLGPEWFGLLMLVWAPLVILARVAMGLHYVSDVIAGMILGILVGILLLMIFI
jgi:undecaprenyl-diphosphatase